MKEKALAAADAGLDTTSRTALNDEYKSLIGQITNAVANAEFNGANMIKQAGTTIKSLANADATSVITVVAQTLTTAALGISTSSLNTKTLASTAIGLINTAITNVSSKLSKLGTGAKALGSHLSFVGKLQGDQVVRALKDAPLDFLRDLWRKTRGQRQHNEPL